MLGQEVFTCAEELCHRQIKHRFVRQQFCRVLISWTLQADTEWLETSMRLSYSHQTTNRHGKEVSGELLMYTDSIHA